MPSAQAYEIRDTAGAMRDIMALATAPISTSIRASPGCSPRIRKNAAEVQSVCTQALNLFRVLMIYLRAGAAEHGGASRAFFRRAGLDLGQRRNAAAGHQHQRL